MDTIHYMIDNAGYISSLTFQHLWLVGLAVGLAIIIGAGGLGLLLLNGIGGSDIRMLIAGALMICLLAIVLDWLLHRLQIVLTPKGIR